MRNPFRYFNSSPEVIRLVVMMYIRYPQECGRWLNNRAENLHQPFRRRERAMAKFRDMKTLQKLSKSLPPPTHQSTTTSTTTAISTVAISSSRTALLRSRNGVNSQRESLD
jgi:transposase-like protein